MANRGCTPISCPFSHNVCTECGIYRGRHRYMVFSADGDGRKNGSKDHIAEYFRAMEALSNPWADKDFKSKENLTISLKLIDAESGKDRSFDLEEARAWDWGDPQTMRIINDRQVTSFQQLMDILSYKESKGDQEVVLYEFPRFMFLCGG
jgi:hypothetical protein